MEGGNNVTGVHGIVVFNETEAVHELDLGDLASAMGLEVSFDIGLGGTSGEIPQVEAGGRDFRHGGVVGGPKLRST